jgi:hypothetical protein
MVFSVHSLARCLTAKHIKIRSFSPWQATVPSFSLVHNIMSDDEFSKYDFAEFTEADFARFDGLAASSSIAVDPNLNTSLPAIAIEVEQPLGRSSSPANSPKQSKDGREGVSKSPFRRFRRNGIFSVMDLVSPAWYVTVFFPSTHGNSWTCYVSGARCSLIMGYAREGPTKSKAGPNHLYLVQVRRYL